VTTPSIVGQRFGRLLVVRESRHGPSRLECVCDCGARKWFGRSNVRLGNTTSCGCLRREKVSTRGGSGWLGELYRQSLRNAESRGLSHSLTRDDVERLVRMDCHYCGAPPANRRKVGPLAEKDRKWNGLDRVDNSRGYEPDNVVPCCPACNWAKCDFSAEEFVEWANRVAAHGRRARLVGA
jgi:hypothetical protein